MPKDYYAILGVQKNATEDEIKKSFRRLAHEHHPDKGGDPQKFKDVNEAFQVLGDKEKRAKYDRFGSAAFEQGGFGGAHGFSGFDGFNINVEDFGDFGDVFSEMFGFGGRGRKAGRRRGQDIETDVRIDFLESVKGATKNVKLYKHDACSACAGSGAEAGSKTETCKTCGGQGAVRQATRTFFGTIQTTVECPECAGTGSKADTACKTCAGTGAERRTKEIQISIPPGIADGEALKVAGEGEFPGKNGQAGDLYVRVSVASHPVFTREGNNVLSTVRIPYSTLVLGGDVDIDTVDGKGSLSIPAGTESGTVFKIRAKGFPYLRSGGRGDMLVTVHPLVPSRPTKEQKMSLEDLRDAGL